MKAKATTTRELTPLQRQIIRILAMKTARKERARMMLEMARKLGERK